MFTAELDSTSVPSTLDGPKCCLTCVCRLRHACAPQRLHVSNTHVVDLSPLSACAALRELDASGSGVWDLAPLAGCTALAWLNLGSTSLAPFLKTRTGNEHCIFRSTDAVTGCIRELQQTVLWA